MPTRRGWMLMVVVLMSPGLAVAAAGDAEKGKPIYSAQCVTCHGRSGDGNGPVGRTLSPRPRAFSKGGLSPDDQLFKVIRQGGKAAGLSKDMDAYPGLSDQQTWDVIAYLKTLAK
jgi:high-affinity iron transporter